LTLLCLQVIELPLKHPELFESLGIAQPKVRLQLARRDAPLHTVPPMQSTPGMASGQEHHASPLSAVDNHGRDEKNAHSQKHSN
jgi:hypothetical protein